MTSIAMFWMSQNQRWRTSNYNWRHDRCIWRKRISDWRREKISDEKQTIATKKSSLAEWQSKTWNRKSEIERLNQKIIRKNQQTWKRELWFEQESWRTIFRDSTIRTMIFKLKPTLRWCWIILYHKQEKNVSNDCTCNIIRNVLNTNHIVNIVRISKYLWRTQHLMFSIHHHCNHHLCVDILENQIFIFYDEEDDNRRIYSLLSVLIVSNDYYKMEVIRFIYLI